MVFVRFHRGHLFEDNCASRRLAKAIEQHLSNSKQQRARLGRSKGDQERLPSPRRILIAPVSTVKSQQYSYLSPTRPKEQEAERLP